MRKWRLRQRQQVLFDYLGGGSHTEWYRNLWNMPQVARPFIHTYFIPWRLATRAIQDSIGWIRIAKTMGVWTFFSNSHPLHFAVYNKLFFLVIGWPKTNPKHIKIKRYRLLPPYLPHEAWKFNKRTNNLTKRFGGLCWRSTKTHWTKINSMMVT